MLDNLLRLCHSVQHNFVHQHITKHITRAMMDNLYQVHMTKIQADKHFVSWSFLSWCGICEAKLNIVFILELFST